MGDTYKEILIQKKSSVFGQIAKVLLLAVTVLFFLVGMMNLIFLAGAVVMGVLCYFVIPRLSVEYEYLYVNGDLDVDAIYSRQKRKRVAEYSSEELELIAPEQSHALDSYRADKTAKIRDFSSGLALDKTYLLVAKKEKGREIARVELDKEVVEDLRRRAPRKVVLS